MYRDKMHVVCTNDVRGTALYIKSLCVKCRANPHYFCSDAAASATATEGGGYVATLKHKSKKIENIDKKTCYILQLCQIPGVSHKVAAAIAGVFPSWKAFMDALHACADDKARITLLKTVDMVADKKAKAILEYIL
jgi:hypothetical protein